MAQRPGKKKVRQRENRFLKRWDLDDTRLATCPLGTWASCNANLAWGHHQEFAELKIVGVLAEYGIEVFDLGLESGSRKPKENDAGVWQLLLEDQLAEIAVGNDQNAVLFPGDCEDVLVGETVGKIPRDCLNVMSEILQVRDKPEISALV